MYKMTGALATLILLVSSCGGGGGDNQEASPKNESNQKGVLNITGSVEHGATLTAELSDPDGLSNVNSITYQWQSNSDNISGANQKGYKIQKADIDANIRVSVNYVDDKGVSASLNSAQTVKVPPVNFEGDISITGTAQQGQVLEAVVSDEDNNGVDTSTVSFIWFADGEEIIGQVSQTFTLPRAAVSKNISVQVSYKDNHGFSEILVSENTSDVIKIDNTPGLVSLTDTSDGSPILQVGATLKAKITDANEVADNIEYFWYIDGDLALGQNQATYAIVEADIGKKITAKAEYVDADGYNESVLSTSSEIVIADGISGGQNYPVGARIAGNNPIDRVAAISNESFEGAGWNAGTINGEYNPGYDKNVPKNFRFTQFQNPNSFAAEATITRFGNYSAKLYWQHGDPGKWNGDVNKIDNVDRKAMFHGRNASSITAATWYGFSVYFPSIGTELIDGEDPLIFQLHGAPDSGEPGRNPPIALTISTDGFNIGYGWDARKFATNTGGEGRDKFQVPVIFSDYQDRWVDFVIQVKANPFEETGFIKMWIDGKQMVDRTSIKIGYNDDKGLYPSWGWYITGDRAADRDKDAIMYYDEIRHAEGVTADYYDVAPGYFAK